MCETRGKQSGLTRRCRSRQFESGQATLASSSPEGLQGEFEPQTALKDISQSAIILTNPQTAPAPSHVRRNSIVDSANAKVVKSLLDAPSKGHDRSTADSSPPLTSSASEYFFRNTPSMATMLHRKIWVKRPSQSATLVQIKEDDLVDDVRDMILRKYANSLGRTFDAPDMTLQIVSRVEQGTNQTIRTLGPEEEMCRTIDQTYPGGQKVDEALIINVPQRRTPKPSPRAQQGYQQAGYYALDDFRPLENGTDYFPPMPVSIPPTVPQTSTSHDSRSSQHHHSVAAGPQTVTVPPVEHHPRSISVINTGQLPPLPSPGGRDRRHQHRPKYQRQPTSSPTILSHPGSGAVVQPAAANAPPQIAHRQSMQPRLDSSASEAVHRPNGIAVPAPPPLPSPPAPEAPPTNRDNSAPPTPSAAVAPVGIGTHGRVGRPKKPRKTTPENQNGSGNAVSSRRKKDFSSASSPHPGAGIASMLDASVPPINVLIVEDNSINLRILEGLMKRLKVRWQTATNGQIAVDKWKAGGFHLVLMDIQMPIMNGLQATKEIRRLERANSIGVFSSTSPDDEERGPDGVAKAAAPSNGESKEKEKEKEKGKSDDALPGLSEGLIKSPVIIVALTASSLQSDRHEALAAGCNDFLTKPVNFVWLERKVKEWGCMQALIDFDGWRRWKEFAGKEEAGKSAEQKLKDREDEEKSRVRADKMAKLQERQAGKAKEDRDRKKRASLTAAELSPAPASPRLQGQREDAPAAVNANGAPLELVSSASLKPGRQVLGDAGVDLG